MVYCVFVFFSYRKLMLFMTKITQNIVIPLNFAKCYLNFVFFSVLNLTLLVLGVIGLSICARSKKFLRVFSCYVFALGHL